MKTPGPIKNSFSEQSQTGNRELPQNVKTWWNSDN